MPDTPKTDDLDETKRIMGRLVNTPPKPRATTQEPRWRITHVEEQDDGTMKVVRTEYRDTLDDEA